MKVLIACEESQAVCIAFRERGHEAYSCDILPCSGGHPEWHIQDDVLKHLNDGWDMMIGHPPCTYLSYAGNGYLDINKYGINAIERINKRHEAWLFFLSLWQSDIEKICLENPKGYPMQFLKNYQIIEPYYFGDHQKKSTLLWLKNLPKLIHSIDDNLFYKRTHVNKPDPVYIDKSGKKRYFTDAISGSSKDAQIKRSKTFPGIARAMASQWSELL